MRFFVGISCAKQKLVLTCADRRDRPSGHSGRWTVDRTQQTEYFGYAMRNYHERKSAGEAHEIVASIDPDYDPDQ
jgi:hypothetical protein